MRVQRLKPTTATARRRVVELRAILNHPRSRAAEKTEALAELDKLSPPVTESNRHLLARGTRGRPRVHSQEIVADISARRGAGETLQSIASITGVPYSTVRYVLRRSAKVQS